MKHVHALLTERIAGPPGFGYALRSFRFLTLFGAACVVEDKYPALTRCWNDLQGLFGKDAAFRDGIFIPSWVFMDFPCGPGGRTVLDLFEAFLAESEQLERFDRFIRAARASRLGLYQEVQRSPQALRLRDVLTQDLVDVHPSIERGEPGEVLLLRPLALEGEAYGWGDAKAFPARARDEIVEMVLRKLHFFPSPEDPRREYETFMKLAGPYWMSCVARDPDLPILEPDHYRTYFDD